MKYGLNSLLLLATLSILGCSSNQSGDEFLGVWIKGKHGLHISRHNDLFLIREPGARTWAKYSNIEHGLSYEDSNLHSIGILKLEDSGRTLVHFGRFFQESYTRPNSTTDLRLLLDKIEFLPGPSPTNILERRILRVEMNVRNGQKKVESHDPDRHEYNLSVLESDKKLLEYLKKELDAQRDRLTK